jgi:glycosyltransferase involved in cell wall biosynthesis
MKVLQVGKFYDPYPGGIETVLKNLCLGLKSRVDVEVLVANTGPTTVREQNGVSITRVANLGTLFSSPLMPTFPYWLRKLPADLLHFHIPNPMAEFAYLFSGVHGKTVVHFHSDIVRQRILLPVYSPFLKRFLERAARIIVPSPNHMKCSAFLPSFREKCRIVPYGVSPDEFALSDEEKRKVERLREEIPTILFVGRLVYYKGVEVLIRAMSDVQARLWVVGTGPLEENLKGLVAQLDLGQKVFFLGKIDQRELVCRYHASDIFALPSVGHGEMFGMVQLEAMSCRKPVISTSLPTGVSWVNVDGVTGLSVPPGDAAALAQAMKKLIRSPAMRKEMGDAGRERVVRTFTVKKMTDGVMEVYKEVVDC